MTTKLAHQPRRLPRHARRDVRLGRLLPADRAAALPHPRNPGVFAAEQTRVREPFANAVELAEQAYAAELQRLVTHQTVHGPPRRLAEGFEGHSHHDLHGALERVQRLNVRSNPDLYSLVDQARQVITGIEIHQHRDSVRLRAMVANDFMRIEQAGGDLLGNRPRRNILRRGQTGPEHERADRDGVARQREWWREVAL